MPTQRRAPRPRPLAALAALAAAALSLSACSAVVPARVAAAADTPAGGYGTARVVDDPTTASVLIVPAHPVGTLAVFVHGSGQSRSSILRDRRDLIVARHLVEHGYLVLAADAGGRAWGDAASVADYERVIASTVAGHGVRDVFLMAESMGGLATMQLAARVPDVRAVTAWYPVCDLRTMQHKPQFAAAIARAWATGDRRVVSPVGVPAVPITIWASPQDTVVSAASNAAVCAAEARQAGARVTYIRTAGEHGSLSNFHPAQVLSFFDAHRATDPARPAAPGSVPKARS
ncbi:MAG TPA: alpha/beta hydrolase [Amnibacterium sp.]|nr:alpha/beta hydrolase [Amnibacterium sp.]